MQPIYKSRSLFQPGDEARTNQAIATAETKTSAEIALVITRFCWGDIRQKAQRLFHKNNLHKTQQRNAVMILIVSANRECLIYGDQGIHEKVTPNFWVESCDRFTQHARDQTPADALVDTIEHLSQTLAQHFPASSTNPNEISNGVIHAP